MAAGKFDLGDMEAEFANPDDLWGDEVFSSAAGADADAMLATADVDYSNSSINFRDFTTLEELTSPSGPVQTPARNHSPDQAVDNMFNTSASTSASPQPFFSTPSSDSSDTFAFKPTTQPWVVTAKDLPQNPQWPLDAASQFTSPANLIASPSPVVGNGQTPSSVAPPVGKSRMVVSSISNKSRVETQINVNLTLETPPLGVEYLHLPHQTIAKSKLLAKDAVDDSKAVELHVMLVCTSAMRNPDFKAKAMRRAAAQDNARIQERARRMKVASEEEKAEMRHVPEDERPANGGEVRICDNCIVREKKRAARKKLKQHEELEHWERYESERVVVFNSSEYLPWKPAETVNNPPTRENSEPYTPPEGAIQVQAAMRIACYCRHQSEKEGFCVIFSIKDQVGNLIAQEMSDSILITDDHKTHPQQFPAALTEGMAFTPTYAFGAPQAQQQFNAPQTALPVSYSMGDLQGHLQSFHSSRSAGNLQSLGYGPQQTSYGSHVHQVPMQANFGNSHMTSATVTPTANLSRPGSPTLLETSSAPSKKRKSSNFGRKLPAGLQMTDINPRAETNPGQQMSEMMSGVSLTSPFSPSTAAFANQPQHEYLAMPQNGGGPAQFFGSGPPTPVTDNGTFIFGQGHAGLSAAAGPAARISRENNQAMQAFYSAPSSRHPSRASSPVRAPSAQHFPPFGSQQMGHSQPSAMMNNSTSNSNAAVAAAAASMMNNGAQPSRPVSQRPNVDARVMEMALRLVAQERTGNPNNWAQIAQESATQYMTQNMSPAGIKDPGS